MYLFAVTRFALTICIFTHAFIILSFILKLVNRKSATCAKYLQNNYIFILREGCITYLVGPDGEADVQDSGLIVTHLQDHVVHTGDFVFQIGVVAQIHLVTGTVVREVAYGKESAFLPRA